MLPISYLSMDESLAVNEIDGCDSKHRVHEIHPVNKNGPSSAALLASEFSEFITAASRLEDSYRALQAQVSELSLELSERNSELSASLKENERMRLALLHIVESMPCGVLVLARDGSVTMINPESQRLLGIKSANSSTAPIPTLETISACSGVNLASAGLESGDEGALEYCVRDASGKRWLEVRNRRLFDKGNLGVVPEQTILILRDITAQRRAEHEREASRKAMALAEITTMLAHEIRNPLASLELFAELIENDETNRREWISNLRAGIRSLAGTVNNVLSFHGSYPVKLSPLSLFELIRNAISFIQPVADQASVRIQYVADYEDVEVMGNESAVKQVVLNLMMNAIKHSHGGKVTVSIRENVGPESDWVTVHFSDSGRGIRDDQINQIFEPGFSGTGDSTGLGLAVCKRIMQQHNGRISASNLTPSGACFTLQFPRLKSGLGTV
jgi:two-component system sensor histidine kinase FlrB